MTIITANPSSMPKWLTDFVIMALVMLLQSLLLPICQRRSHAKPTAIAIATARGLGARLWTDEDVPYNLKPLLIFISFVASFVGSYTTVELLHRRTTKGGWLKWMQLGLCSVTFGLCGIWCMHFIGNRAIIMGKGQNELQLFYDPGWSAISGLLPVLAVLIAFGTSNVAIRSKFIRTTRDIIAGFICGCAIGGMHYTGNLGISNFTIHNDARFMGGAFTIACTASVVVIFILFRFQDFWTSTWFRRFISASIMAGAVTGMHFEASYGTSYTLKRYNHRTTWVRNQNVVIACIFCILALIGCIIAFMWSAQKRKSQINRARRVTLVSATFDQNGKIMCSSDFTLPNRSITSKWNHRSFDDEFSSAHDDYQWILKACNNWSAIQPYLDVMSHHLYSVLCMDNPAMATPDRGKPWALNAADEKFSLLFREGFCVSAADLAEVLGVDIENIGRLHDEAMTSGGLAPRRAKGWAYWKQVCSWNSAGDMENGQSASDIWGKGQVLFLARTIKGTEVPRYASNNWRFMAIEDIAKSLEHTMKMPQKYLEDFLFKVRDECRHGAHHTPLKTHTTYLNFFAVRPGILRQKWSLLVESLLTDRLPGVTMWSELSSNEYQLQLHVLDGTSYESCVRYCERNKDALNEETARFAKSFLRALIDLRCKVPPHLLPSSTFSSKLIKVRTSNAGGVFQYHSMLIFHLLPDIHTSNVTDDRWQYTDLGLFKCKQDPLDDDFVVRVHQDFSALFSGREVIRPVSVPGATTFLPRVRSLLKRPSLHSIQSTATAATGIQRASPQLSKRQRTLDISTAANTKSLPRDGGIHVHQLVTVEPTSPRYGEDEEAVEMDEMVQSGISMKTTTRGQAVAGAQETVGWVDEAFRIATAQYSRG